MLADADDRRDSRHNADSLLDLLLTQAGSKVHCFGVLRLRLRALNPLTLNPKQTLNPLNLKPLSSKL